MLAGMLAEHAKAAPHPPQLFTSAAVLTSQPSTALLLQSVHPLSHVPIWQAPDTQLPPAWVYLVSQLLPQVPQLVLVLVAVSQPSEVSPLQLPQSAAQDPMAQLPAAQ